MKKCDPIRALQETQHVIHGGLCQFHLEICHDWEA